MVGRARWIFWALLAVAVAIAVAWFRRRSPLLAELAAELDSREAEARERLASTTAEQARLKLASAETAAQASRAEKRAEEAARQARIAVVDRALIAARLAEEVDDAERARRFNSRHGLADPLSGPR